MPTSELPILESEVQKSANLSDKAAWKWVNRIFPESVRGEERPDIPGQSWGKDKVQYWYRRGYVQFYGSVKELRWDNAIVGYRSDKFWNPKQFLQLE